MKPMLASKLDDPTKLNYPVLASPKLDGVRCLIISGEPVSRNLKPIPNQSIRDILSGLPPMDGELIIGNPRATDCYTKTVSGVMSREGMPKFMFWVFDALTARPMPFKERLVLARSYAGSSGGTVGLVDHRLIKSSEELLEYEAKQVLAGFEGIMIRDPDGPYKHGRSTPREGYLLKLKRFEDGEAEVIGFVEKEHNDNERTQDALGRAKRSSHKSGKRPAETLGALIVQDKVTGVQFRIGSGFSESQRADIWVSRGTCGSLLGRTVKYRFQPAGVKDAPRFPTFIGERHEDDA